MELPFKHVSIIGLGYIGLPTAAVLASRGVKVTGVDVRKVVVDTINKGNIHIVEPDLDKIVHSAVTEGKLTATMTPVSADVYIIAVPTPFKGNHEPDISFVESAACSIAPVLKKGDLIILESTSPVGTTEKISELLATLRTDLIFPHDKKKIPNVHIAYCPERVLPGKILKEIIENDRVIGGITKACAEMAMQLYKIFVEGECFMTDARTAEMAKLTENSFRDVNIAFANELSLICEQLNIDVFELISLTNRHPRVKILQPGPGVGGHCIAVDPWFIVSASPKEAKLIRTAREVNDSKPHHVAGLIKAAAKEIQDPKIACFGLAFKANIDDLRESPAMEIAQMLAQEKLGEVIIVEPFIKTLPENLKGFPNVRMTNIETALTEADIIVGLVGHDDFKAIEKQKLKNKIVIDTCGMWR